MFGDRNIVTTGRYRPAMVDASRNYDVIAP